MDAKARRKFARDSFKERMAQAMEADFIIGFKVEVNEHYDCPRMWGFKGVYLKEEMPNIHPSTCRNSMGCGCTWETAIFEDENSPLAEALQKRRDHKHVIEVILDVPPHPVKNCAQPIDVLKTEINDTGGIPTVELVDIKHSDTCTRQAEIIRKAIETCHTVPEEKSEVQGRDYAAVLYVGIVIVGLVAAVVASFIY